MEINQVKTVKVDAKTLKVHLKVTDRFSADLVDKDGVHLASAEDTYVPRFFPGDHYGDYVILDIDLDTGHITNWKAPKAEAVEEYFFGEEN